MQYFVCGFLFGCVDKIYNKIDLAQRFSSGTQCKIIKGLKKYVFTLANLQTY